MSKALYCAAPECTELARRGGFCWTHYQWSRDGKNLSAEKNKRKAGMDPLERLTEAARTLWELPTDEDHDPDHRRAVDNLCAAAERYTAKLWRERAREAQRLARKRGKHIGRPKGTFRGQSRWSRWRREVFRQVIEGASAQ